MNRCELCLTCLVCPKGLCGSSCVSKPLTEHNWRKENIGAGVIDFRHRTAETIGQDLPLFLQYLEQHHIYIDNPCLLNINICKPCCSAYYRWRGIFTLLCHDILA